MRVLITGSRDWEGRVAETRIHIILETILALCDMLGEKLIVVHGDCPTGADAIADRWARRRDDLGVEVEAHPADWDRYGSSAGPLRNQEMVNRGAGMCIGFLRNNSRGTRHCLNLARMFGIPTYTVVWGSDAE